MRVVAVLHLVRDARSRLEREPLRIAVAPGVDRAAAGRPRKDRVVRGDRAVAVHAQDLAVERVRVLRVAQIARVAHGHPELPVRTEAQAAAVVVPGGDHGASDHESVERDEVPDELVPEHLIAVLALVVARSADVDEGVQREVRIDGDAHEAALAVLARPDDGIVRELRRTWRGALIHEEIADAFAHEHAAVRQRCDVPGDAEARLQRRDGQARHRSAGHGDGDEDALVVHPDRAIDHRPQREDVGARSRRRLDLEGERRIRAGRDGRLGLRGRPRSAEPIDAEGGPGQLVVLDTDARLLAEHALHPGLATGIAERERDRLARHSRREIGHDRLPEPAAVIAGVAGHEHEDALMLEPRDTVGHRAEWQSVHAEPRR